MADLDEFLKPRVQIDIGGGEEPCTVWNIPFTQYLRPNGRKRAENFVTARKEVAEKAQKILDAGFGFTSELLMTGDASFTIEGQCEHSEGDDPELDDVARALAPNGPKVVDAVEEMIMKFQIPEDGIVRKWKNG